jgi:hypothetical protein
LDGVKYLDKISGEDYGATISALTYPDEFEVCQGIHVISDGLFATAQKHSSFGLTYRTKIGNDVKGLDFAYKIHIIFNASVAPLKKTYNTIDDAASLEPFSWDIVATPVDLAGFRSTAHLIIDSRYTNPTVLLEIEDLLYGGSSFDPHIPVLGNIIQLFTAGGQIQVIDNGNGTWTAIGPQEFFSMLDEKTFQIIEIPAVYLNDHEYQISSSGLVLPPDDGGDGGGGAPSDTITDPIVDPI